MRDAEPPTRFLSHRPERFEVPALTFSALMAGVARAVYAPQAGIINPSELAPTTRSTR